MSNELFARCPCGHRISTGILLDSRTLAKLWQSSVNVACPHCGETHAIEVRKAYMTNILSYEGVRGVRVNADVRRTP
jgi:DNA-directed RNA polymerase subunit RPC12/RpoP